MTNKKEKMKIRIEYVQLMVRDEKGLTLIGQPVKRKFAVKVIKQLFGNDPSIRGVPSVPPKKLREKVTLKKLG